MRMSDTRIQVACQGHGRQSLFLKMNKQNKKSVSHHLLTLLLCEGYGMESLFFWRNNSDG